ncbi:MAG: hypothetical protein WAJ85_02480 [Candidatus Baltobacteraceae bacterium]|jgi:Flp pilus assembly pilin Flp
MANLALAIRARNPGGLAQKAMVAAVRRLLADESGQGIVEYTLLLTFTALICFVGLHYLGGKTNNTLLNAANNLS